MAEPKTMKVSQRSMPAKTSRSMSPPPFMLTISSETSNRSARAACSSLAAKGTVSSKRSDAKALRSGGDARLLREAPAECTVWEADL